MSKQPSKLSNLCCLALSRRSLRQQSFMKQIALMNGILSLFFYVSEIVEKDQKFRKDKRCGSSFKLDNGNISECDPYNDMYYCCSKWGYCGDTSEHCDCSDCVDYRKHYSLNITSKVEGMPLISL